MDYIFEIIIHVMMAYFQIIMILFGSLFVFMGGASFVSIAQQKKSKQRWISAIVTAIREGEGMAGENGMKGKIYYPVFESGMVQYECRSGSSDINKFVIGARHRVLPLEKEPHFVSIEGDERNDVIIGCFLVVIGGMMIGLPVTFIPITSVSFAIWIVTILVLIFKFKKRIKPKHLRETVAAFKERRAVEALVKHQSNHEVTKEYIINHNQIVKKIGQGMSKLSLVIGFIFLCLGGAGYNAQLEFIDNAVFEKTGPCGLELGEDCRRTISYQDILSVMPLELRPVMDGVYHSKYEPDKIIVSYGAWTPLPYFILMILGALIFLSNARSLSVTNKSL